MKPRGSEAVRAWLNAQLAEGLYTTTLNLAELYAGSGVEVVDPWGYQS